MALGHDIGHPPFGHDGERFLSEKCLEHGIGPFLHNVQSVRFLQEVEKGGRGLNLTLQVLDGVLCHDGEVHSDRLEPREGRDFADLDRLIAAKQADPRQELIPMTLEGAWYAWPTPWPTWAATWRTPSCWGSSRGKDLPGPVTGVLGNTNGTIVYRLVEDLIMSSTRDGRLAFSPGGGRGPERPQAFQPGAHLHQSPHQARASQIREAFHRLFDRYLEDLAGRRADSPVYGHFLDQMDPAYCSRPGAGGYCAGFHSLHDR